jgi:hypothetical protein
MHAYAVLGFAQTQKQAVCVSANNGTHWPMAVGETSKMRRMFVPCLQGRYRYAIFHVSAIQSDRKKY